MGNRYVERELEIKVSSGSTVADVIALFTAGQQTPTGNAFIGNPRKKLIENHGVTINGIGVTPEKQSAIEVKDSDRIFIFLPVAGG